MVIIDDFIYVGKDKKSKRYKLNCDKCGADRGYSMKSRSDLLCKKCTHKGKDYLVNKRNDEYKEKMSNSKKGQIPWNKGILSNTKEQKILRNNMSCAIRSRLFKRGSSKKGISYLDKVDYTIEELHDHLENLFELGMTWNNYGKGANKWNIDHIVPDSWFTYTSMDCDGFKQSWALSNLQPMWELENMSKSNHYSGKYIS